MNIKKIVSYAAATAVAVSAMAISAFAADPITVKLNSQNTDSWTMYSSEEYQITGDGDYTFTLDAGGEDHYITLYIKDVTEKAPANGGYENAVMTINSITVNGKKLALTKTEFPVLNESTGVFDVCPINGWAETFVTADECLFGDAEGGSYEYGEPVNTFEVNCTISGIGGAAEAPAAEAPAAEAPADEAPAVEAPADEASAAEAPADEDAPAADAETTSTATGNTAAAVMVSVMALAGAAAIASRKNK